MKIPLRIDMTLPRKCSHTAVLIAVTLLAAAPARADKLENGVAVFSALDKVTATIKILEVPLDQTIEFGALKVTPHACYTRPATEQPKTTTYVDVDEVQLDGQQKRIFSGWMFAESPALNAVEHPVFDVWLTGCQKPKNAVASTAKASPVEGASPETTDPNAASGADLPRRRVKR